MDFDPRRPPFVVEETKRIENCEYHSPDRREATCAHRRVGERLTGWPAIGRVRDVVGGALAPDASPTVTTRGIGPNLPWTAIPAD